MQKIQQREIFDTWLEAHKGILFKVTHSYAFTPLDREDLFQEICVRVWKSIPDFRGESKTSTWIYSVALYAAIAWTRKERKHEQKTKPLASVEHMLIANEHQLDSRLVWLYEQIGQLSDVDRSLCLLMLDGYTYAEMAEFVGLSASNVGVKIHRIKQQLLQLAQQENLSPVTNR